MRSSGAVAALLLMSSAGCTATAGGPEPRTSEDGCADPSIGPGAPIAGSVAVNGAVRTYQLAVPSGDGQVPRALVLVFHGKGGDGIGMRNYVGRSMETAAQGNAIFVYPDGVDDGPGWPNQGGKDVAFVDALLAKLATQVCYDRARVFATGFSYGGYMSNTLGCARGGAIRAIAPVSGGGPWGSCAAPVAAWIAHGVTDTTVALSQGESSRDRWQAVNGCDATTQAVTPAPCVALGGCGANPVVWCAFDQGHTVPSWAPAAIWSFFDGLP